MRATRIDDRHGQLTNGLAFGLPTSPAGVCAAGDATTNDFGFDSAGVATAMVPVGPATGASGAVAAAFESVLRGALA